MRTGSRWGGYGALWWALACALIACDGDGAPGAQDRALPDAAVDAALDASPGPPVGARCEAGRCAAGADCVGGRCTRPCLGDADCPEADLICVGAAQGLGQCAPACGAPGDCAPDEICATEAPGLGGCVAPGPGEAGATCDGNAACASRVCSEGVCLAACDVEGCPADTACLALHTQSVCVTASRGADEAPCARGADCATGVCRGGRCTTTCADGVCPHDRVCRPYQQLSLCERRCADTARCGPGGACALVAGLTQCVTRGAGAPGAACDGPGDCASAVCRGDGACATPCAVDGGCPAGEACLTDISGSTCRPAGSAAAGAPCGGDTDCASGLCAAGRCGEGCAAGGCPAGLRCTRFLTGAFCFAPCRDDAECPAAAFCDPRFAEGPTCFWRGVVGDDGRCTAHGDCASGRCADGRCLPACADGQCPGDRACVAFATGAWCSPAPRVSGAACEGDAACEAGLQCTSGLCAPPCAEGCPSGTACAEGADGAQGCRPQCVADRDCRPGFACARFDGPVAVCTKAGTLPGDAACTRSMDCRDGLCLAGRCRAACPGGACVGAARCVAFDGGAWCLPAGDGAVGAVCEVTGDCDGAVCAGRRCAPPCGPGGACAVGTACRATRLGALCLSPCDPVSGVGCDAGEGCAPEGGGAAGRCALAEGAPLGEACETGCAPPGRCVVDASADAVARCRAPCGADADCGADAACVRLQPTDARGVCLPAGAAPTGSPCAAGPDCAGGACSAPGGRCGRPCDRDDDCGRGDCCVDPDRDPFTADGRCAPACAADADCPAGLGCRLNGQGQGACWQPVGP